LLKFFLAFAAGGVYFFPAPLITLFTFNYVAYSPVKPEAKRQGLSGARRTEAIRAPPPL